MTAVVGSTEALHTVFRPGPDGRAAQFREPAHEPRIDRVELGGRPLAQAAARWFTELPPFELGTRPPVRFAVAGPAGPGRDRVLLVALHHIVIDTFGVLALRELLASAFAGRPLPAARAAATVDPAGPDRAGEAALRYWAGVLDDYPATTLPFDSALGGGGQRAVSLGCRDGAAVAQLARRCRVPESMLIPAMFVLALVRAGGNRRTVARVSSANRFDPGDASRITCLAQVVPVPLTVPAAGALGDWTRTVKAAFGAVYRYGRFDVDRVRTLAARRQFTSGVNLETMVSLNYLDRGAAEDPAVGAGEVVAQEAFLEIPDPLGLLVRRAGPHLTLTVQFDPDLVPESLVRSMLSCTERLLLRARGAADLIEELLADPELPSPPEPGPGRWVERDGCRIGLHVIEDLLRAHPGVSFCRVETPPDDPGRIVASVRGLGPFDCRIHLLAHLAAHPAAVVPDWFVTDTAEGSATGLDAPPFAAGSPAGGALSDALARLHPGASWSGAASFLTAGGEVGTIDAMLRLLAEAGFTGLDYADLYGFVPPAHLEARLRTPVAQS